MQHHHPDLPAARSPEDRVHAYLVSGARGPWPATSELLGHAPSLERLDLEQTPRALPAGVPGVGDLVLVLTTPGGGVIHAVLTGPLAQGLVALLVDPGEGHPAPTPTTTTPPTPTLVPLAPAEAGLLAGLAAVALRDLEAPQRPDARPNPNGAAVGGAVDGAVGDAVEGAVDGDVNKAIAIQDVAVIRDDGGPPRGLPTDPALMCQLRLTCGPASGHLLLLLDAAAARTLRTSASRWLPPLSDAGAKLPLMAELVLARTELRWSCLTNAGPGDAIVFPTPATPDNHWPIHLAVAGLLYPATLRRTDHGREVEIQGHPMEPTQSGPPSDAIAEPADAPGHGDLLDRLPVTLTAVLGRVELTAGDVARLAPGAVISLDHPVGGTVQLRAGSRSIGVGELVEVDGSMGIRLTELTL